VRRTAEDIQKHRDNKSGLYDSPLNRDDVKWFRPGKGESQFRTLPATWEGKAHYGYEVWAHRFVGANSSTYLCSEKMNTGKPCAACDEMRRMKKAGATKEELREINPQQRFWYYVVDRDVPSDIPSIYDVSWKQDREITDQTVSQRTGETLHIDDPDDGYDVIVKKSGSGKENTTYTFSVDRHTSPLMKRQGDADKLRVFAEDNPIPTLLKFFPYEHIERNLGGGARTRDDDLDSGRGKDRDDGRGRDRGRDRDDDRGRDRDGAADDRGRDRDRDDRDRDDDRARGRSRLDPDDDRGRTDDRGRDRGDADRDADRDRDRGGDRDRGDDRDRDRDADRERGRDTRDSGDRGRDRDDDRGRSRDDDRGGSRDDDRDRDDGRRDRQRR
jgi:hypothetical protein